MRIALVHDYLVQHGGAERVLECFSELFPYAPIYTLLYDEKNTHGIFKEKDIRTSFLQKWPLAKKHHRAFPPLMPLAIEKFDFSKYDVVLSDSASYAKGIITGPETLHICYMHTPMRYAWDDCQKYTKDFHFPKLIKKVVPVMMNYIRIWDKVSADRIDKIIANSNFVKKRIRKYYRRKSVVIYPPVNFNNFNTKEKLKKPDGVEEKYYLMVGRLIAYKRFDIAIKAFNKLGKNLKIIGRGPELNKLKKIAGDNIEFLHRVNDENLAKYYAHSEAFIFPQEEDFGIVAIEALASGRPVIAFWGGDIPEHLKEGETGIFFKKQTSKNIVEAVKKFEKNKKNFNPAHIRSQAEKFDREYFKARIKEYIEKELENFKSK